LEELPNIQRLARELEARGVATILITDEAPSAGLASFLRERGVRLPVYSDVRREAAVAFESFGTPDLFLVDASGRIRFNERPLENIPREAEVLLEEGRSRRPNAF
jgi:peroxiredoxin